ncbi:polyprenyl synthetase family protein [Lederbergia galactosidilytica]|uniref:Farnesyl diphosphate synthase n=1 Tax=Lederbergia galactosidilytica TaxID=217031 RepID=A0A178A5D0_9BACI|nr:farnesyl diphosphate synthase [Lederbergia galactosidilytica]KRG15656.1 farnesyl-diphosphate synthase [Virgibacillus soli]OAK75311.1 farnesyl-diphosphate synthase [Lederbergia galactosidilytica]
MSVNLEEYFNHYKQKLDENLIHAIEELPAPKSLKDAMKYSLKAGGKRIRPLLLFASIHAYGKDPEMGMATACALEMIHTYSLIHDDLPSMDDDDLRRGRPTNHKVYGEALAILAGDGLLTYGFELIANDENLNDADKVWLIQLLAKNAGPVGMVGGQVADIEAENKELTIKELEYIHHHKTGKLLSFGVLAGAKIAGANANELKLFEEFSQHLGLAFQISDDILDVIGDEKVIGKPVGSDDGKAKSTYPALLTLDGANEQLSYHTEQAKAALNLTNQNTDLLYYLTDLIADRNN